MEFQIEKSIATDSWNLFITNREAGSLAFGYFHKGKLVFKSVSSGVMGEPALSIRADVAVEFYSALIKGISGSVPDHIRQSFKEGELLATKYHLSDMRQLHRNLLNQIDNATDPADGV